MLEAVLLELDQKTMSPALICAIGTRGPSAYWLREVLERRRPAPLWKTYSMKPEQSKPTVLRSSIPLGLQQIPFVGPKALPPPHEYGYLPSMPLAAAMVAVTFADCVGAGGGGVVPLHSGATSPSDPVLTNV